VMTTSRFLLVALLLMGAAALAQADGVPTDPRMDVSDPTCGDGCTILTGTSFMFSSNSNGGGFLTFENDSESNWTSLLIETTGIAADTVNATSNLFENTPEVYNIGNLLVIYFSGVSGPGCEEDCFPGIPNSSDENVFTINLNTNPDDTSTNGTGGWGPDLGFSANANVPAPTVPEPATLTLIAVGLGALLAKKSLPLGDDTPRANSLFW